jgi:hypothetical protein
MKEHPILFSAPMVLAILEGRKTQTRRVINLAQQFGNPQMTKPGVATFLNMDHANPYDGAVDICCRHGQPGDRLWVRETWKCEELESGLDGVRYAANNHFRPIENTREAADAWGDANRPGGRWRPSIFMPRWASRITLEIVNIRAERVQDISEQDALAEGARHITLSAIMSVPMPWDVRPPQGYRAGFKNLWDSINDPRGYGWKINPWAWVIEFKKL